MAITHSNRAIFLNDSLKLTILAKSFSIDHQWDNVDLISVKH